MRPGLARRNPALGFLIVLVLAALAAGGREGLRWIRSERLDGAAFAIDGDSLRLNGRELRLVGIDAPEYRQVCHVADREDACGHRAREHLVTLLRGGTVTCRVESTDRYGRGLAVCTAAGRDVNAAMVRDGWAIAYGRYDAEESQARAARAGIWAMRVEFPAEWRARHPRRDLDR
jgi:endonuclease YncB( thermonuclease family)